MNKEQKSKSEKKVSTAIDVINAKLMELEPHVIASDRKEAIKRIKYGHPVIHRYLHNQGTVYETALAYYELFTERIKERKEKVDKILSESIIENQSMK